MSKVFQPLVGSAMLFRVGMAVEAGSFSAWYAFGAVCGLALVLSHMVDE